MWNIVSGRESKYWNDTSRISWGNIVGPYTLPFNDFYIHRWCGLRSCISLARTMEQRWHETVSRERILRRNQIPRWKTIAAIQVVLAFARFCAIGAANESCAEIKFARRKQWRWFISRLIRSNSLSLSLSSPSHGKTNFSTKSDKRAW